MQLTFLKSKLHRATVTGADLNYEGSISIGAPLREAAKLYLNEKVDILNINTGARFSTYVIPGQTDNEVALNGAAARLVQEGDKVIIVSYCTIDESEANTHVPRVVLLEDCNDIKDIIS